MKIKLSGLTGPSERPNVKEHNFFGVSMFKKSSPCIHQTSNIYVRVIHTKHTLLQDAIMVQPPPVQRRAGSTDPIPVPHAAGLGPHDHQIGPDAGAPHVRRDDAAGVAQAPLHRQRVPFALVRRGGGGQGTGGAEVRADPLVVVGGHLQRKAGDHEELVKDLVDAQVLLGGRLHEHAAGVLALAVGLGLVYGYGSRTIYKWKFQRINSKSKLLFK